MMDSDGRDQGEEGQGWVGRAFGRVLGIFSPNKSSPSLASRLPPDADDDLPVRGGSRKRRREEEEVQTNGRNGHSNSRDTVPDKAEAEESDDSSLEQVVVEPSRKKSRGRHYKGPTEEIHLVAHIPESKRLNEKTQKAAKRAGQAASSSKEPAAPSRHESAMTKAKEPKKKAAERAGAKKTGKRVDAKKIEPPSPKTKKKKVEEEPPRDQMDDEDSLDIDLDAISVEEEEDIEITWPLMPTRTKLGVSYYSWVEIDGVRLYRGDSVYLRSGTKTPYIGKLVELKQDDEDGPTCSVAWWYRIGDLEGESMDSKELMESTHLETNPLQSISTSRRPKILFGNDPKTKAKAKADPDTYFYYRFYDVTTNKVQVLTF